MKRNCAALLLLVATTAIAGEPLTLDQAVGAAIANNAGVRNAQIELERGQTRIDAAKTKRLPQFTLEAIGGEALNNFSIKVEETNTRIDLARTFSMFGIARMTQPLTQLHAIGLNVKLNEASLAVDKEHERAARIATRREVTSAYFAVLSAKSYAVAMQEAVTASEEVEREMNVRVSQKAALEADHLDATARYAAAKLGALSANNALASAQDRLNYLVGRDVDVMEPSLDATASASANAANRPDVREAELRVQQAKLGMRIKAAERIPEVALTVSSATPINNDLLPSNMTSAGLSMKYEPFTWGRRKAELNEKRHAVEQAEIALRDKREAATLEIAVLQRRVGESAAQIAVRRLESDAARERLRVTKARFHEQAARPDEMFGAGASLTQAAAREQEAISAYWTARADYEKAIGQE